MHVLRHSLALPFLVGCFASHGRLDDSADPTPHGAHPDSHVPLPERRWVSVVWDTCQCCPECACDGTFDTEIDLGAISSPTIVVFAGTVDCQLLPES